MIVSLPEEPFERLRHAIDAAERDWTVVHSDDEDGKAWIEAIVAWSSVLLEAASTLVEHEALPWLRDSNLGQGAGPPSKAVRNIELSSLLQVRLSRAALERARGAAKQLPVLLDSLVHAPANEMARGYVARVASLFLWGFDAEAIVFARSAVEQTLKDLLPEIPEGFRIRGSVPDLSERIASARQAGILSTQGADAAHALRNAANEALHDAPGLYTYVRDPADAIAKLRLIMRDASSAGPGRHAM